MSDIAAFNVHFFSCTLPLPSMLYTLQTLFWILESKHRARDSILCCGIFVSRYFFVIYRLSYSVVNESWKPITTCHENRGIGYLKGFYRLLMKLSVGTATKSKDLWFLSVRDLNLKKLSEEKKSLKKIEEKSDLLKNSSPQRRKKW